MSGKRRLVGIALSSVLLLDVLAVSRNTSDIVENVNQAQDTVIPEAYTILHSTYNEDEEEAIRDEIFYGEMELLAQLIQAEAGNQDELGKRYVADVVLNRVDSDKFPDKIEDVIFQMNPVQFSCVVDGNFNKAGWTVTEDCFTIALEEYEDRENSDILYFSSTGYITSKHEFKHGDHYFSR